jgi:hypothetical protein
MPLSIQAVILSPGADDTGIHRSGSAIDASQVGQTIKIQRKAPEGLSSTYLYVLITPTKLQFHLMAHGSLLPCIRV